MIEHSEKIDQLAAALHKAQAAAEGVVKDATNPHFRNRYASLEAVIETARPALQESGIAFTQAPGAIVEGAIEITTMLLHTSGQWMRSTLHVPLGKRDAQGVGSAITYGCRYSLMATLGLPPVDDDGEEATKPAPPPARRQQARYEADDGQNDADSAVEGSRERYVKECQQRIASPQETPDSLRAWWDREKDVRRGFGLSQTDVDALKALLMARLNPERVAA